MCLFMRNLSSGFPTRPDTSRAVELQKMARGEKVRVKKMDRTFYVAKANAKVTAQLICSVVFAYAKKTCFLTTRLIY